MSVPEFQPDSTFFVLDFDRTLGNTDKFHDVLGMVIERETQISAASLHEAHMNAIHAGLPFDTIDYVKRILPRHTAHITWQHILQTFIAEAKKQDMLMPHAADLMNLLDERELSYGIVTFGMETWQLAKLEAASLLDVPHVVTQIEEKGILLTGWRHDNGKFIIPPVLSRTFTQIEVDTVVFLDDKAKSFNDIPPNVIGVRVLPAGSETLLPQQQGVLPAGVTSVRGLDGAISYLFS